MSYIPSYLQNVERDGTGWPIGMAESETEALILLVKEALENHGGTASLDQIQRYSKGDSVKLRYKEKCPMYYKSSLWDYIYAALDRAVRKIACQTWTLEKSLH